MHYVLSDYASTFGKGPTFRIANNSDVNSHSFSLLGYTSNVYRHILIMLIYHQKQSHFQLVPKILKFIFWNKTILNLIIYIKNLTSYRKKFFLQSRSHIKSLFNHLIIQPILQAKDTVKNNIITSTTNLIQWNL